jgi:hypothetical protein
MLLQAAVPEPQATPGAIVATQTFGQWPDRYHPHLHVVATDGAFYGQGMFQVAHRFQLKDLEALFRHRVLSMLPRKGKITREFIRMMQGLETLRVQRLLWRKDLPVRCTQTGPSPSEAIHGTSCRLPHPGLVLSRTCGLSPRGGQGLLALQRWQG